MSRLNNLTWNIILTFHISMGKNNSPFHRKRCLSDLCTCHYDKKNAPHFFYLEKFFKRKSMYSFAKGELAVNFSFIQRSLKRLLVEEWNGKYSFFFQWMHAKGIISVSSFCKGITSRIPKMILFWFQSNWILIQQVPISNIMSMKSRKRSIVKNGLCGYFIWSRCSFREIVKTVWSQ